MVVEKRARLSQARGKEKELGKAELFMAGMNFLGEPELGSFLLQAISRCWLSVADEPKQNESPLMQNPLIVTSQTAYGNNEAINNLHRKN